MEDSTVQPAPVTKNGLVLNMQQRRFYASEQCTEARRALTLLANNPAYQTYVDTHVDDPQKFVDRHLTYLSTHPQVKLAGYISNLKLMTSRRRR